MDPVVRYLLEVSIQQNQLFQEMGDGKAQLSEEDVED